MLREIEAFVGDAPQHDDMTMILLKVDDVGVDVDAEPRARRDAMTSATHSRSAFTP